MQRIADKSVDMILCDLPYETLNKGNKSTEWDRLIPFDPLWEQYNRIIKDNGAIVLFAQGMFTAQLMLSNPKIWRYNLVWDKVLISGFLNANRMPLRNHEDICVFYKKPPTYNPQMHQGKPQHSMGTAYKEKNSRKNSCYGNFENRDDMKVGNMEKYPTSILSFPKPHPSVSIHPTQKPVALLEYLIKTYTNEGETVLDNTMGSGSTGVACVNTDRNFIGIELDNEYFKTASVRIEKAERDRADKLFRE